MPEPQTKLAFENAHPRDAFISFEEEPHIYTVLGERGTYTSVTTLVHKNFPHFDADKIAENCIKNPKKMADPTYKYYGMTKQDVLDVWNKNGLQASQAGTAVHYDIECWANDTPVLNDSVEYGYFLNFLADYPNLKPYRTEWMVYHEDLKFCGSIDMVFQDVDTKQFYIYDWKRVKEIKYDDAFCDYSIHPKIAHLPNLNFWHYSLQLGIYKRILETKYDIVISGMFLICLHPDNPIKNYERIEVANLEAEIDILFSVEE
jgi:hypothetical protein